VGQNRVHKELVGSCRWLAGETPNRKVLPGLQKWERNSISSFPSIQFQELGCQERTNCGSATITILNIFLKAYLDNGPSPQQHSLIHNSCIFLHIFTAFFPQKNDELQAATCNNAVTGKRVVAGMYSKVSSILPTACWADYITERIKCLLCQQGNYIQKKTPTFIKSLPKTELWAKIQNDGCIDSLNFKSSFSCKAHSNPASPLYLPKASFIFSLITVSTTQPSTASRFSWKTMGVIRGFSFVSVFFLIAPSLFIVKDIFFPLQSLSKASSNSFYRLQKDSWCSQALC